MWGNCWHDWRQIYLSVYERMKQNIEKGKTKQWQQNKNNNIQLIYMHLMLTWFNSICSLAMCRKLFLLLRWCFLCLLVSTCFCLVFSRLIVLLLGNFERLFPPPPKKMWRATGQTCGKHFSIGVFNFVFFFLFWFVCLFGCCWFQIVLRRFCWWCLGCYSDWLHWFIVVLDSFLCFGFVLLLFSVVTCSKVGLGPFYFRVQEPRIWFIYVESCVFWVWVFLGVWFWNQYWKRSLLKKVTIIKWVS